MRHTEPPCPCLYLVVVFRWSCAPLSRSYGGNAASVRHRDICASLRNDHSLPNYSYAAAHAPLDWHANLNVRLDFTFNTPVFLDRCQ